MSPRDSDFFLYKRDEKLPTRSTKKRNARSGGGGKKGSYEDPFSLLRYFVFVFFLSMESVSVCVPEAFALSISLFLFLLGYFPRFYYSAEVMLLRVLAFAELPQTWSWTVPPFFLKPNISGTGTPDALIRCIIGVLGSLCLFFKGTQIT